MYIKTKLLFLFFILQRLIKIPKRHDATGFLFFFFFLFREGIVKEYFFSIAFDNWVTELRNVPVGCRDVFSLKGRGKFLKHCLEFFQNFQKKKKSKIVRRKFRNISKGTHPTSECRECSGTRIAEMVPRKILGAPVVPQHQYNYTVVFCAVLWPFSLLGCYYLLL